jgi:hypothetical protein
VRRAGTTVLLIGFADKENRTMDNKSPLASNPFAFLMNPEDVLQAMERSDRLGRLQRRICKPLDKPVIARAPDEVASFDHEVDDSPEAASED